MKATLLIVAGAAALLLSGCETDLPENPNQRPVSFGNNLPREAGNERPAAPATDAGRNVW